MSEVSNLLWYHILSKADLKLSTLVLQTIFSGKSFQAVMHLKGYINIKVWSSLRHTTGLNNQLPLNGKRTPFREKKRKGLLLLRKETRFCMNIRNANIYQRKILLYNMFEEKN